MVIRRTKKRDARSIDVTRRAGMQRLLALLAAGTPLGLRDDFRVPLWPGRSGVRM